MTKLLALAALLLGACNDTTSPSTATSSASPAIGATAANGTSAAKGTTAAAGTERPSAAAAGLTGGPGEPSVDPTMPSWAPKSCVAYHKAVVEALDCVALEKGKHARISSAYGTAIEAWKAETNGTPERIQVISAACERDMASVHADVEGTCVVSKT